MPHSYQTADADYRVVEGVLGAAQRAADFNLHWGSAGTIDSVIDVTHNVPVPFDSLQLARLLGRVQSGGNRGRGIVRWPARRANHDGLHLRQPAAVFSSGAGQLPLCSGPLPSQPRAVPGPVAIWDRAATNAKTAAVRSGAGFALYLAGNISVFELTGGLPAAGTVWSLRTYVGAISGGRGAAGDRGPYTFAAQPRPLTAVGVELRAITRW